MLREKSDKKEYCMTSFIENSRKFNFLETRDGGDGEEVGGRNYTRGNFQDDGNVHLLYCGDGFQACINTSKLLTLDT